jgi:hypothetical protein
MFSLIWPESASNGAHATIFNQLIGFTCGIAAHYYLLHPGQARIKSFVSNQQVVPSFMCSSSLSNSQHPILNGRLQLLVTSITVMDRSLREIYLL